LQINKIHIDFRKDIIAKHTEISNKIQILMNLFENDDPIARNT
jgi:hypothetical protein